MKVRIWIPVLFATVLVAGCGVSGISLNSMYLKQNYLGVVQHADNTQQLDDYGVLKICQSWLKIQHFESYSSCREELKRRANEQGGVLAGQVPGETLSRNLTGAIFDVMHAEFELGLGNYEHSIALGEQALASLDGEPYAVETVVDVAGSRFEALTVLLASYAATDDKTKVLATIERVKGLAELRYRGDSGFRLIGDFKILPVLTQAYYAIGEYRKALDYSRQAIEITEDISALETVFYSAMTTLSSSAFNEQSADGGLQSFEETLFSHRLQPRVIAARSNLELGNYLAAQTGFDQVLSSELISGIALLYYPVLHDRGRVAEALGDRQLAEKYYRQSIEVFENSRASIKTDISKIAYVGNKQSVYASLVNNLYRQNKLAEAFEVAENAKARALVDLLASRKSGLEAVDLARPALPEARDLDEAYARIEQKTTAERIKTRGVDRGLLRRAKERLKEKAPEYASLVTVDPARIADIQRLLSDGELLLEYYAANDDLYIFSITRESIQAVRTDYGALKDEVEIFRKSLVKVDTQDYKRFGKRLYDRLIKPLESEVVAARGLSIVPHGVLHYMPFGALYTGRDFFVARKPIRLLPSASVLAFLSSEVERRDSILIIGNPDLGESAMNLEGAHQEANVIAGIRENARLLLRERATETEVKTSAGAYGALHFASHGVFDSDTPLASRLLLTGDNENDGNLTVGELYQLTIDADLVTLSACETGLGSVASGDDVVGFSRGFLYAGAQSIVSSLWKVDDDATRLLMQNFYQNLERMDKREALAQSQKALKNVYPHPYYWAAFQLTGAF